MGKIRFRIDEKALYYGIYNDYERGEVMTSSTPINQSKDKKKWHKDIIKFIESGLEEKGNIPERLLNQLTRKTTSQANTRINQLYVFNNILIDGQRLKTSYSFVLYVKEEIDASITRKDGTKGPNTHLGRLKLHNPSNIKYNLDGYNINNKEVLKSILVQNGGFAYIVRGFEVDSEKKTLNFITSLIGLNGVFLSNVFKKKKGVGKKLLLDEIALEAQDVAPDSTMLVKYGEENDNARETDFDSLRKIQIENVKLGEKYVYDHLLELIDEYASDVFHTSERYPTSPYDIEYTDDKGVKQYVEVKSTSGSREVFNMSSGEIKFMNQYSDRYVLLLVTGVKSSMPKVKVFRSKQIIGMRKEYPSTRFYVD